MAKKKVFVSFDYEKDKHYKFMLQAWDANPEFDFYFSDLSADEIKSKSVPVVKQVLSAIGLQIPDDLLRRVFLLNNFQYFRIAFP